MREEKEEEHLDRAAESRGGLELRVAESHGQELEGRGGGGRGRAPGRTTDEDVDAWSSQGATTSPSSTADQSTAGTPPAVQRWHHMHGRRRKHLKPH